MSSDHIHSLKELSAALAADPRFVGYEVVSAEEGVLEVRVGEAGLAFVDARVFSDPRKLTPHLIRSRAGSTRLVLVGSEDELASAAAHGDGTEMSLMVLPVSRARAALTLPTELDLVTLRTRSRERGRTADRYRYELGELLAISRAISSERDVEKLLAVILEKSRYVTGADAGSVYIIVNAESNDADTAAAGPRSAVAATASATVATATATVATDMARVQAGTRATGQTRERVLRFMIAQNDSVDIDFREFTLPIDATSIVGTAVLTRSIVNIPDLYRLGEPGRNPWGFHHNRALDEKTGYRTHSMLTFPLINQRDEAIGVIQLINRKKDPSARLRVDPSLPDGGVNFAEDVIPFEKRSEELCETLAAQAGVSLENALLYDEIRNLFEGFVNASVTAIESRDPTTSGHSLRVARLTTGLAQAIDRTEAGPYRDLHFTSDDLKQIEYAGLLHDFGKVGVRENVLVKARKLYEHERDLLLARFDYIRKSIETDAYRRRFDDILAGRVPPADARSPLLHDEQVGAQLARLDEMVALILHANEPTVLAEGSFERIAEVATHTYVDARGEVRPYLTPSEVESLKVQRGSLTVAERAEIESHVVHTYNFLATIPWGRRLWKIPQIAGSHHEKLDGTGYPRGLRAPDIPVESRMMLIADIFDALTASDRPYKRAVPVERALAILEDEVSHGKADRDLFQVFVEAKVWKRTT